MHQHTNNFEKNSNNIWNLSLCIDEKGLVLLHSAKLLKAVLAGVLNRDVKLVKIEGKLAKCIFDSFTIFQTSKTLHY